MDVTWQQNKRHNISAENTVTKETLVKLFSAPVETVLAMHLNPSVLVACCDSCVGKGDVDKKSSVPEQEVCRVA